MGEANMDINSNESMLPCPNITTDSIARLPLYIPDGLVTVQNTNITSNMYYKQMELSAVPIDYLQAVNVQANEQDC